MPCLFSMSLVCLLNLRLKAHKFIPVVRQAPPHKVNTNGSFTSPNHAGFGGLFRDSHDHFLSGFSFKVKVLSTIDAKILAVIEAVSVA